MELQNYNEKEHETIVLGETVINISGKACNVTVSRLSNGNIEITPTDEGIWEEDGWLCDGTTTEGWSNEIIKCKFKH